MIVKCASCQTRFKIGDDKVTEKGVKVRCTKCGTVFVVRKGDEQQAPPAPSSRSKVPLPPSAAGSLDDLFAVPVAPGAPGPSPTSVISAMDDPFAGFLAGSPTPAKSNLMPGEFALSDAELAASATPPPPGATPMSDLLGLDTSWPQASPPPPPSPRAPAPAKSTPSKPPKRPAAADEPDPFDAALDPLGSPGSVHPPPDPFANLATDGGADPGSFGLPSGFDAPGDPGFDPLAGLSLDPGAVPQTGDEPPSGGSAATSASELFEAPPPRPPVQPAIETTHSPLETTVERQTKSQTFDLEDEDDRLEKPLSVKIFNALAGASVVTLMLLAFIAYRNGGRIDLHDPLSAFFTAFGFSRPTAVSQSLTTRITESGLYTNLRGDPILFARGSVENLSSGPQRVGLKLEVSSQGQVVASADGLPGLFVSPEDLFQAKNAQEVKAVLDRVFSAPTQPIPAGGRSDFLLVVPDTPAAILSSTDTAELKVTAHPLVNVADAPQSAATK